MTINSVLVTGTTGFLGRRLVAQLKQRGHRITSLQRSAEVVDGVDDVIIIEDFNAAEISKRLSNTSFDWLLHLAAYGVKPQDRDPGTMQRINVVLTQHLVQESARWPAKAVFIAGSGSEYATCDQPVSECAPLERHALYGASKAAGTLRAMSVASAHGLSLAVGRIFGVYGPGEPPHRLLPTLFQHLSRNERVPLSIGTQLRDLLYVDDVISATLALTEHVERSKTQVIANVASGKPVTIRSVAEMVAEELGAPSSLLGFGDLPLRPDETRCFSGRSDRIETLTGWRPAYDLRDGIRRSLAELQT